MQHHIHPVQHIGEAGGLEQHGPVGNLAVLLHGADPLLVLLVQVVKLRLSLIQLLLLIRNQLAVGLNLGIQIVHLLKQQGNLLVNQALFRHNRFHFLHVAGKLALELLNFLVVFRLLGFQLVNLLLNLVGGFGGGHGGGEEACQQAQQQHTCQKSRHNGSQAFSISHVCLLGLSYILPQCRFTYLVGST